MNPILQRYASMQVPRYTSYPTAAEFSTDVVASDHLRWLRQLDGTESISAYIHVPYCRDICLYCGCHSKKTTRDDVIADYGKALEREIQLVGDVLTAPIRVARLHWGGGTPSILGGKGLESVIDMLRRTFVFEVGFEHAIELDPRYVTVALVDRLADFGVNRVSLGVQDVNPLVQAAIGRIQPLQMVEAAVQRLRAAKIQNFNFDLMYGLPLQTTDSLRRTCNIVAALSPNRIACYGYAHIPQRKASQRRINVEMLPGTSERFAQAEIIAEEFLRLGYVKVGIDHFAKPDDSLARVAASGKIHRNFQGYTDDDKNVLIGFGSSAISSLHDGYTQNAADVPTYARTVNHGQFATVRGCSISATDRKRASIIESLLCQFEVNLGAIAPDMDFEEELLLLRSFEADGLVSIHNRIVSITNQGQPIARVVASVFDLFYRDRIGCFSVAI